MPRRARLEQGPACTVNSRNDVSIVPVAEADGGVDFRSASKLFDFGILGGIEPMPLASQTLVDGAAMRIATLEVPLPADEVVRRYDRQLGANGVHAIYGDLKGSEGTHYLTFTPAGTRVSRTIIVVPEGKSSIVLLSVGDPSHMLDTKAEFPPGLPHPDGASTLVVDESRDGPRVQTDLAFTWPKHGVPEGKQYYETEMAKFGFHLEKSTWNLDQPKRWHQTFSRGAENVGVTVDKQGEDLRIAVLWIHT